MRFNSIISVIACISFQVSANPYFGQFDDRISAIAGQAGQIQGIKHSDSNLFVLVSFSMPENLLKQYLHEANLYGASLVIRGLVDNDLLHTQVKIKELLGENKQGGVLIDPNLFTSYQVESVPAFLLTSDEYPCQASACSAKDFDILYGAVSLQYALESFEARGDLKAAAATHLAGER